MRATPARDCQLRINGRFLTQPITGVQRYAHELLRALDALLAKPAHRALGVEVLVPRGAPPPPSWSRIGVRAVGVLGGHAWEQLELPRFVDGALLLNPCNSAPAWLRRQLVTVHDAAVFDVPDAFSFSFRHWYRFLLRRLCRRALGIITVSQFSRARLVARCGLAADAGVVVYHGADHILRAPSDPGVLERHGLEAGRYVLVVGGYGRRKNLGAVAAALGRIDLGEIRVAVTGARNAAVFGRDTSGGGVGVVWLGHVGDGELRALYENARCLVYPSLYEGFGLPPLEAQSCGCPVLVSAATSLPEICRGGVLFCDPHDPGDIAARLASLVDDEPLRRRLRGEAAANASRYTWERCARETLQVVTDAIERAA